MADVPEILKKTPPGDREAIQKVLTELDESRRFHDNFVTRVEKNYRAYRGVLERQSQAAQWTSKLHPPYAFQLIETVTANMIDDKTVFRMHPRPIMDDYARVEEYIQGSEALENIVRYEMEMDRLAKKQRPITLQNSIAGLSPAKIAWDYQEGIGRRYDTVERPVLHPDTGEQIGTFPVLVEQEHSRIVRDGPTINPIDVRDFFWPENAQDVQQAKFIIHRVWMSLDELKQRSDFKNVDQLTETRDISDWERRNWRGDELFMTNRERGMIEVLERHGADGEIITIANRRVLLKRERNTFWHGQKPFVVFSALPQPFQFVGVSDMETIRHLQEALWTTMNQRLDNLALINNAIIILRDTADDQEYEFAPGEFWQVEDPTEVQMWQPNPLPAEVSMGAEAALKGDLNNITGGLGLMSGTENDTIDSKTATGVSTFTSLAQRRLAQRRQNFAYSWADAGDQLISNIQQFMTEDRLVPAIGKDGAALFKRVSPMQVQGRYVCSVEVISESLMRQERRAEAQALFTLALQAAPLMAATQSPINLAQSYKDLLEAFDKEDADKYFASAQQNLQQPGQGGGGGGQNGPPNVAPPQNGPPSLQPQPLGVTAPQAAAATSPSNQVSQSPAMMLQRALAMRGGGRNV